MSSGPSPIERQMADVDLRPFTLEDFHRRRHQKERNRRITTGVTGLVLLAVVAGGVLRTISSDDQTVDSAVLGPLESPFEGTWTSLDVDGSSQVMVIERIAGDEHEIVVHDDAATVCAMAPSTVTGRGQVRTLTELVVDAEIDCDDGTTPALTGADFELLAAFRFVHDPEQDELVDSTGVLWEREGAPVRIMPGASPFEGTWVVGIAGQYSPDTMEIRVVDDEDLHEATMLKAETPQCDGGPSTMTGTGRREIDREASGLVRLSAVFDLSCDDGRAPVAQAEQEIGAFDDLTITFVHDPVTDQVVGSLGSLFVREGASLAQGDPMATVDRMIDAVNTGDANAFMDLYAPDGTFHPRGFFVSSVTPGGQLVSRLDRAEAWMSINEAWGFEAEVISCTTAPPEPARVNTLIDCEIASRWPNLSLEVTELWQFELRGERLVHWEPVPLVLDPADRELPLGFPGLEAWEAWLTANHPEDAARWLNPSADPSPDPGPVWVAAEAGNSWVVDGLEFRPTRLVPYDPALASPIDASIDDYLEEQ
jgi:hypothetical protein